MQKVRTSLLDTKCSEEVKLTLTVAIKDLDIKINRFSQKLLQYQNIESTWKTDYWYSKSTGFRALDKLHKLCTLTNVKITSCLYQSKRNPKWQISNGSGPSQLQSPVSLAIEHSYDDIYVSDLDGTRIQVFSPEGEHNQLIMLNNGPLKVFSVSDSILAYNTKDHSIFEFDVDSMDKCLAKYPCKMSLKKVIPALHGRYYSIRERREYTWYGSGQWILHQTLSELCEPQEGPQSLPIKKLPQVSTLKESNLISLKITPVDIAYYQKSIFLLSSQGGDLIYEFNLEFSLVRSFFSCPTMKRPLAMCVDRKGNIIVAGDGVSDSDSDLVSDQDIAAPSINQSEITKLFVLSQKGDVIIHEMDIPCKNCIGVAVNSEFDIFLLNKDDKYVLSSL